MRGAPLARGCRVRGLLLWSIALATIVPSWAAAQGSSGVDRYRAHLERVAADGQWWTTSNAAYRDEDAGNDAYVVRHWINDDGLSASGCMWAVRGEDRWIIWTFFEGWDGASGRALHYQSSRSGATGVGREVHASDSVLVVEQRFLFPGSETPERIAHRTEWTSAARYRTSSTAWRDGEWQSGRTYVWELGRDGEPLCGPADAAGGVTLRTPLRLERRPRATKASRTNW